MPLFQCRYLVLGVEHILLGIDHLLFVLALFILVKGTARLIATVTAFTVAHSLTLAGATLGFLLVPGPPVEAGIALSIVFVAAEIVHSRQGRIGLTERFPPFGDDPVPRCAPPTTPSNPAPRRPHQPPTRIQEVATAASRRRQRVGPIAGRSADQRRWENLSKELSKKKLAKRRPDDMAFGRARARLFRPCAGPIAAALNLHVKRGRVASFRAVAGAREIRAAAPPIYFWLLLCSTAAVAAAL